MSDADLEKSGNQSMNASDDQTTGGGPDMGSIADDASLAVELQAANDRVLRAQAELENFRKRSRREQEDQRRYANLTLLGDLLPVLDNLNRALTAADQTDTASGLLEGVKMVSSQMLSVFEQHGCRPIEAHGVPFDPNLHEAIGKEPSLELAEGMVTRVTREGYQLHDRVVRPPQVLISGGPPTNQNDSPSGFPTDGTPAE